jgi:hypothetical protein
VNGENAKKYTQYERMLIEAFEHPYRVPNVFAFIEIPLAIRDIYRAFFSTGIPIRELEDQYLALRSEVLPGSAEEQGRRDRHKAFQSGLTALLGCPEHSALAMDYLLENRRAYVEIFGFSFFDATDKAGEKFQWLVKSSVSHPVPNLLRDQHGRCREAALIDSLIYQQSDAYALLMSAVTNADAESVSLLQRCQQFNRYISKSDLLGVLTFQVKEFPDHGLKAAFRHYFDHKDNATFLARMNALCSSTEATKAEFRDAFWPGAVQYAIDQVVSNGLRFSYDCKPQIGYMLDVFKEQGVDFYPAVILHEEGYGVYFDATLKDFDLAARQDHLMGFVSKRLSGKAGSDFSAMLVDIPWERLQAHRDADVLLKHLYQGTQDRNVLKLIEDKQFRGKTLEDQLGM